MGKGITRWIPNPRNGGWIMGVSVETRVPGIGDGRNPPYSEFFLYLLQYAKIEDVRLRNYGMRLVPEELLVHKAQLGAQLSQWLTKYQMMPRGNYSLSQVLEYLGHLLLHTAGQGIQETKTSIINELREFQ